MRTFIDAEIPGSRSWPLAGQPGHRRPVAVDMLACAAGLLGADLLAVLAAHAVALGASWPVAGVFGPSHGRPVLALPGAREAGVSLCIVAGVLSCLAGCGHYREKLPFWTEARQVLVAGLFAFLVAGLANTMSGPGRIPSAEWLIFAPLALACRRIAKQGLDRGGLWRMPVLVVGGIASRAPLVEILSSGTLPGYRVAGVVGPEIADLIASTGGWRRQLREANAARLAIVAGPDNEDDRKIVSTVIRERVPFFILPHWNAFPVVGWRAIPFFSHDRILLSYCNNLAQPLSRFAKHALDVAGAALLLALSSPLMALIAVLVASDGGRPIFAHERIGANGRRFRCLKFRTMVTNGAEVLRQAFERDPVLAAEWAAVRKLKRDPRVTPVGRILRRTSLDELPQLINVLRGEMSLVGPRPIVAEEVGRYADDIAFYYGTRPGLTGLWQVSGRSETSFQQRVRLDASYVRNWTIWHDVAILAKTVSVVLGRRGAH